MNEREGSRYASGMYELLNHSYQRSKKVIKYFKWSSLKILTVLLHQTAAVCSSFLLIYI